MAASQENIRTYQYRCAMPVEGLTIAFTQQRLRVAYWNALATHVRRARRSLSRSPRAKTPDPPLAPQSAGFDLKTVRAQFRAQGLYHGNYQDVERAFRAVLRRVGPPHPRRYDPWSGTVSYWFMKGLPVSQLSCDPVFVSNRFPHGRPELVCVMQSGQGSCAFASVPITRGSQSGSRSPSSCIARYQPTASSVSCVSSGGLLRASICRRPRWSNASSVLSGSTTRRSLQHSVLLASTGLFRNNSLLGYDASLSGQRALSLLCQVGQLSLGRPAGMQQWHSAGEWSRIADCDVAIGSATMAPRATLSFRTRGLPT